uniref:Sulfotransferase n=1 Tax=Crocodylus porosus TaxID=8502 RepID=A0A7M4EK51_CROPO
PDAAGEGEAPGQWSSLSVDSLLIRVQLGAVLLSRRRGARPGPPSLPRLLRAPTQPCRGLIRLGVTEPLPCPTGTTWMQEILTLMYSKGDGQLAKTVPNWARAPWLEHIYFKDMMQAGREPRIITTHLPCHVLAPALKKAKVIYVARNPKDIVVSFYHFHKMAKFLPEPSSFEDFLMQFLNGTVQYGSWFDHVEGWLSQRSELDLFYITYEDLHRVSCPRGLGRDTPAQCCLLPGALEVSAIQQHSSFSAMQKNAMVNYTLVSCDILDHSKGQFMRKGRTEGSRGGGLPSSQITPRPRRRTGGCCGSSPTPPRPPRPARPRCSASPAPPARR